MCHEIGRDRELEGSRLLVHLLLVVFARCRVGGPLLIMMGSRRKPTPEVQPRERRPRVPTPEVYIAVILPASVGLPLSLPQNCHSCSLYSWIFQGLGLVRPMHSDEKWAPSVDGVLVDGARRATKGGSE